MSDRVTRRRAASNLRDDVGQRLRDERERHGISLRALAREIGISASALSQIETGRSRPSVTTLHAVAAELGMSLDELFVPEAPAAGPAALRDLEPHDPVVREAERAAITLDSGVRWERLTAHEDRTVDFLHVTYAVGGASSPDRTFVRHGGREYALVLSGELRVSTGFATHDLGPGDSISFDASIPHLVENLGDQPATASWVVIGRHQDPRVARSESSSALVASDGSSRSSASARQQSR